MRSEEEKELREAVHILRENDNPTAELAERVLSVIE